MRPLRVECYRTPVPYGPMHALQLQRQAEIQANQQQDTLFLLEHQPVITIGRNGSTQFLCASPEQLRAEGIEVFQVGRGGDITYHGPGQLVGYLLLQLQAHEQDLPAFVGRIEQLLISVAKQVGVVAHTLPGKRGIWCGRDKLAAIGVRIARWTTMHGFALNLEGALSGFSWMVPCGLQGHGVTSLADQSQQKIERTSIEHQLLQAIPTYFQRQPLVEVATALPPSCPGLEPLQDWAGPSALPIHGLEGVSP